MLIAVLENKFIASFIIIFLNCNQHLAISRHDSFRVRLMTAVEKNKFIVPFIIIFGTLSFPILVLWATVWSGATVGPVVDSCC